MHDAASELHKLVLLSIASEWLPPSNRKSILMHTLQGDRFNTTINTNLFHCTSSFDLLRTVPPANAMYQTSACTEYSR